MEYFANSFAEDMVY